MVHSRLAKAGEGLEAVRALRSSFLRRECEEEPVLAPDSRSREMLMYAFPVCATVLRGWWLQLVLLALKIVLKLTHPFIRILEY